MIGSTLSVVTALVAEFLKSAFFKYAYDNIKDVSKRAYVRSQVENACDAAAAVTADALVHTRLDSIANAVLTSAEEVIRNTTVDQMVEFARLSPERLLEYFVEKMAKVPEVDAEGRQDLYRKVLEEPSRMLCRLAPKFKEFEVSVWQENFKGLDDLAKQLRTEANEIKEKVDQVPQATKEILYNADLDQFKKNWKYLVDQVLSRARAHRLPNLAMTPIPVTDIEDIYVELALQTFREPEDRKVDIDDEISYSKALERARKAFSQEEKVAGKTIADLISATKYLAIIGSPGSGKSLALQRLVGQVASGKVQIGGKITLPLLLKLRDIDSSLFQAASSFEDFTLKAVAEKALGKNALDAVSSDIWKQAREYGYPVLLLIDGLDEVQAPSEDGEEEENVRRRHAVAWMRGLAQAWPEFSVLLTSRPTGRHGVPINTEKEEKPVFTEVEICPFIKPQIEEYSQKWVRVWHGATLTEEERKAECNRLARDIFSRMQSHDSVRVMACNPLLLATICVVHREEGHIPEQRHKLYERCVNGLLGPWREKTGYREEFPCWYDQSLRLHLLSNLALEMLRQGKAEAQKVFVLQCFSKVLPSQDQSETALHLLEDRSGLLLQQRPGMYAFSHLGFQEYLAAQELWWQHASTKEGRLEPLKLYLEQSHWQEAVLLYLANAVRGSGYQDEFLVYLFEKDEEDFIIKVLTQGILTPESLAKREKVESWLFNQYCAGWWQWHFESDLFMALKRLDGKNPGIAKLCSQAITEKNEFEGALSVAFLAMQERWEELDASTSIRGNPRDLLTDLFPFFDNIPNVFNKFFRGILPWGEVWGLSAWTVSHIPNCMEIKGGKILRGGYLALSRALTRAQGQAQLQAHVRDLKKARSHVRARNQALNRANDFARALARVQDRALARIRDRARMEALDWTRALDLARSYSRLRYRDLARDLALEPIRARSLSLSQWIGKDSSDNSLVKSWLDNIPSSQEPALRAEKTLLISTAQKVGISGSAELPLDLFLNACSWDKNRCFYSYVAVFLNAMIHNDEWIMEKMIVELNERVPNLEGNERIVAYFLGLDALVGLDYSDKEMDRVIKENPDPPA